MATLRVRAVANVMGLRRGDEGDVETGSPQVDAMLERGYLQVLEYLPDPPEPVVRAAAPQPPEEAPVDPKEKSSGGKGKGSSRSRTSRPRSQAKRNKASDTGDSADTRSDKRPNSGGHGESESSEPDERPVGDA